MCACVCVCTHVCVHVLQEQARKLRDKSTELQEMNNVCTYVCVLTYEAGRGRIGLDILLSVALNHIPEFPHIAGVKDVEGLARMELAVLRVRTEQVVVGTGIPLRKKEGRAAEVRPHLEMKTFTLLHSGQSTVLHSFKSQL